MEACFECRNPLVLSTLPSNVNEDEAEKRNNFEVSFDESSSAVASELWSSVCKATAQKMSVRGSNFLNSNLL